MNSTILFTAGAKGGSGKTTAARFLVTYLREQGADPLPTQESAAADPLLPPLVHDS